MTSIACLYDNRGWKAPKQSTLDVHPSGAARADDFHVLFEPGVDLPGVAIAADGAYGVTVADPDELPRVLKDAQDAVGGRSAGVSVSFPGVQSPLFLRLALGADRPERRTMVPRVRDTRILSYEPLISPTALLEELPLGDARAAVVERSRDEARAVLDGADDRLLVVAGPCSVHDPAAALDYACQLAGLRDQFSSDLLIVMRVYFDKPRTVTG